MSGWKPALGLLSLPWPSWYHRRPKSILSSTTEKKRWRWPKRFCSTTTDNSPTGALFTSRSSWRLPAFIASFNFCKEEQNCEISFFCGAEHFAHLAVASPLRRWWRSCNLQPPYLLIAYLENSEILGQIFTTFYDLYYGSHFLRLPLITNFLQRGNTQYAEVDVSSLPSFWTRDTFTCKTARRPVLGCFVDKMQKKEINDCYNPPTDTETHLAIVNKPKPVLAKVFSSDFPQERFESHN